MSGDHSLKSPTTATDVSPFVAWRRNITWQPPEATYLAWLDCTALGKGDAPRELFLEKGLVGLEPGLRFGREGGGHVRLNFATSADILDQAVARMAAAV